MGPLSLHELRATLDTLENTKKVFVWREGFSGWKPPNEVPELQPVLSREVDLYPRIEERVSSASPSAQTRNNRNKFFEALKNIGGFALGIGMLLITVTLALVFIYGATWISAVAIPYMAYATNIAVAVCLTVLLPLALFRKTRSFAAVGFLISSYVFGVCLWMYGLLITMGLWGVLGVILGLMLFGVGVVPVGMLASIFNAEWTMLLILVVGTLFTYGTRMLAIWLEERAEAARYG